jgi:hypothetical protein
MTDASLCPGVFAGPAPPTPVRIAARTSARSLNASNTRIISSRTCAFIAFTRVHRWAIHSDDRDVIAHGASNDLGVHRGVPHKR